MASTLNAGELFTLESLVTPSAQGIASRVLARTAAGNITLFAFDAALTLTIGGVNVRTEPQTIVLMPANVPHAVRAAEPSRMLLIMLREAPGQGSVPAVTPEVR